MHILWSYSSVTDNHPNVNELSSGVFCPWVDRDDIRASGHCSTSIKPFLRNRFVMDLVTARFQ